MPRPRTALAHRLPLLLAAIALTLGVAAAPSTAAFPGRDGLIVYSWFSFEESELGPPFTTRSESALKAVDPSGGIPATTLRGCARATGQPDVGDCATGYGSPAISPNGRLIAFDAGTSLGLMRIDGSQVRLLPAQSDDDSQPAFSPSGKRLAFTAGPVANVHHPLARGVRTSDLHGADVRQLTARGYGPAWSARNWIAFMRVDGVYRVRPDGHDLRRLVVQHRCSDVAWSPDGTRLAFTCQVVHSDRLFVANGDGSHVRRVATHYLSPEGVAWSPSGKRLLVSSFEGTLVTVRLDGSHERGIVSGGAGATYTFGAGSADWQPLP